MPESFQERSFRFATEVLRTYRTLSFKTDTPQPLLAQMLRAGTAIGANLAEARSASSRRDLIAKNAIALREARECHHWLRLIRTDQPKFVQVLDPVAAECEQRISILSAAVRTLHDG
jgi:four helix bundle protein